RSLLRMRQTLHPVGHALFCGAVPEERPQQLPERQCVSDNFRGVPATPDLRREPHPRQDRLQSLDVRTLVLVEIEELLVWLAGLAGGRAFGEVVAGQRHAALVDRNLPETIGRA